MTFLQYIIVFLILYICVYQLVHRICTCVEKCEMSKAGAFVEQLRMNHDFLLEKEKLRNANEEESGHAETQVDEK